MSDDTKGADDKLVTRAYVDLFSGAAQEVGDRLTRAASLALAPIDLVLWSAEKVKTFVSEDLPARLRARGVDPDRITSPPPQILGGVLAGLQVAGPDEPLREMFASLLATSMDASKADRAHPAFVEIIRQLLPEEARLFRYVLASRGQLDLSVSSLTEDLVTGGESPHGAALREIGVACGLRTPEFADRYLENLARLGLVTSSRPSLAFTEPVRTPTGKHEAMITVEHGRVLLTPFGRQFAEGCVELDGWVVDSGQIEDAARS